MCGLVGALVGKTANNFATKDIDKIMSTLLYLDTFRGHHATGVLVMEKKGTKFVGKFLKEPIPGDIFVETSAFKKLKSSFSSSSLVLGHNRYATMGGTSKAAAHPHATKNVVLAHNGTLTRFQELAKEPDGLNDLDSARIAYEIEASGSNTTLFSKLFGAYALTWVDHRTDSFYIARNDDRPLWYCVVEKQLMLYASNKWMLDAVQTVHKLTYDVHPTPVPKEKLHQFDLNTFEITYETKDGKSYYTINGLTTVEFKNAPAITHIYPTTYNHGQSYDHTQKKHQPYTNHKPVSDPLVISEISRSNNVLKNTGFSVGQDVEVIVDYINFGSKKKKVGGVGYGCTMSKPSTDVVFVDVSGADLEDDAYSYNATIIGASLKSVDLEEIIVIYAKIKELVKVVLTPKEYSNIFSGSYEQAEEIQKLLGAEIVVACGDDTAVPGPKGLSLSKTTYAEATAGGCSKCGVDISTHDPSTVSWSHDNKPVCNTCHTTQKTLNFVGLNEDESDRVFMEAS